MNKLKKSFMFKARVRLLTSLNDKLARFHVQSVGSNVGKCELKLKPSFIFKAWVKQNGLKKLQNPSHSNCGILGV